MRKKVTRKPSKKKTAEQKEKRPINRSPAAFEKAFYDRIGQTPQEFITTKLSVGSSVSSTRYLFEITAAAIAQKNNCIAGEFEKYYKPLLKERTEPVKRTIKYHKLVRDGIPEIIEASGKRCVTEILNDEQYIQMLDAKLQEELNEYQESKSLEELADLLEVMGAVVKARGYTWDELTGIRKAKKEKRGAFEKRILLKEVIED